MMPAVHPKLLIYLDNSKQSDDEEKICSRNNKKNDKSESKNSKNNKNIAGTYKNILTN